MNFGIYKHIRRKLRQRVFLDYASITPVDSRVLKEMERYSGSQYANPSALYKEALLSKDAIDEARDKISDILNCQKSEMVFTASGTEGNNLAILGIFESHKTEKFIPHFITTTIEHPSIAFLTALSSQMSARTKRWRGFP